MALSVGRLSRLWARLALEVRKPGEAMKLNNKSVLICDCDGSMPLDGKAIGRACGGEALPVSRQLCRDQIDRFLDAARSGEPLLVACTQEAAAFTESLEESGLETDVGFVNIRETAGWSVDAKAASPKIAALLAEAALDAPDVPTVEMVSSGICLVYGPGSVAQDAARQLNDRMTVSLLYSDVGDASPLGAMDLLSSTGRIVGARGHLGEFEVSVDGYAAVDPSSRSEFFVGRASNGAAARCDVILDLSGGVPMFPSPERRDGYLRADPADAVAVQKAIFDVADLIGEFEKPRYVVFKQDLCAHSRSQITGCTRCLDVCPASAIMPNGDFVEIDPYLCGGCGSCNAVCPTQASSYTAPSDQYLLQRTRTLLETYRSAGGKAPVLMFHAEDHGRDILEASARFGQGLPARVIPVAVRQSTQLNAETLLSSLAFGAERIVVLVSGARRSELDGLAQQIGLSEAMMTGIGYDSGRVGVLVEDDPDALEAYLSKLPKPGKENESPAGFLPQSEKRANLRMASDHLFRQAPSPVESVALPPGSAFGTLNIDVEGCTLCLSCVGACPTNALMDNPDRPQLSFQESACIQCGLCKSTCPEQVIALEPRFRFGEGANERTTVKEEDPFECISCGKPFAAKSTIEKMLETLGGKHWMFEGAGADRLKMCEDCRVEAVFTDAPHLASGQRPMPRTTDDYLAARDKGEEELD